MKECKKYFLPSSKIKQLLIKFFGKKIDKIKVSDFGDYKIKFSWYLFKNKLYFSGVRKIKNNLTKQLKE